MKVGLITTTVNVPMVLRLYRRLDSDVRFFVAVENDPVQAGRIQSWLYENVSNAATTCVGHPEYKCSDLTGWCTIARRNIALLEALKWGADVIVTIDDDNIPVDEDYFRSFRSVLDSDAFAPRIPFHGIKANGGFGWFDPCSLQFPVGGRRVVQRGFPQNAMMTAFRGMAFGSVADAKIGVAQGMILGDPDTSAVDRISQRPEVHQVSELLRAGIVTDPKECYAPLNSQNLAFIRQLAPCFLMVPSYDRYDDIYASLVAQRVMREHNLFVHYGQPFAFQQRNPHNLLADLRKEQWGAEHILELAAWLDAFQGQHDVIGMLRVMATNLPKFITERCPRGTQELWLAWLSDCEAVMK
jgi:hypothetical protein